MLQRVTGQATSQRWYCLPSTQARTGMCRPALRLRGRFRRLPPVLKTRLSHAQFRTCRNRRECCRTGSREFLYNLRTMTAAQRRWLLLLERQLIENRQSSCVAFRPMLPGSEGHKNNMIIVRWLFSRYLPLSAPPPPPDLRHVNSRDAGAFQLQQRIAAETSLREHRMGPANVSWPGLFTCSFSPVPRPD